MSELNYEGYVTTWLSSNPTMDALRASILLLASTIDQTHKRTEEANKRTEEAMDKITRLMAADSRQKEAELSAKQSEICDLRNQVAYLKLSLTCINYE